MSPYMHSRRQHMFFFNKQEVYNGNSIEESAKIRDILNANNIPYKLEVVSHSGQWTGRGAVRSITGSTDMNPDLDHLTIIYVKKDDYEQAVHVIQEEKRKSR
jgi:hypothetical protein